MNRKYITGCKFLFWLSPFLLFGFPAFAYDLLLSNSPDRNTPAQVHEQTVSGNIYVFVAVEPEISRVDFYLNDPDLLGNPFRRENYAPYDLAGTHGGAMNAKPFDTLGLADGTHAITAVVVTNLNNQEQLNAVFTVANAIPALEFQPAIAVLSHTLGGSSEQLEVNLVSNNGIATSFELESPAPWLQFAPDSDITDTIISVVANPAGLAAGTYSGSLTATAAGYNSATLNVVFNIEDPVNPDPYTLFVSSSPNRDNPAPLAGQSLTEEAYIFTSPDNNVSRVRFFLDDPSRSTPVQVENVVPYDFAGTAGSSAARPWDTSLVSDGTHSVQAEVLTADGQLHLASASFEIGNDAGIAYRLMLSDSPDRANPVLLNTTTVTDDMYVFVDPETSITTVEFFVDDPMAVGLPELIDSQSPFDLAGTAGNGTALPYDTNQLTSGAHSILARIENEDSVIEIVQATFTVANVSTALEVIPSTLNINTTVDGSTVDSNIQISVSDGSSVQLDLTSNATWLSTNPVSGLSPLNAIVRINPTGLAVGTYSGTLDVTATDVTSTSLIVSLTVESDGSASIEVSPPGLNFDMLADADGCFPVACSQILVDKPYLLDFSLPGGSDQIQEISVTASDGATAPFAVESNQAWIIAQSSGVAPTNLSIGIDPSNLSPGAHFGTVTITATGYSSYSVGIDVQISADYGFVEDESGLGTGFTYLDFPSQSTGYIPANIELDIADSALRLTTTKGLAYRQNNSQDNAVGVGIDAASRSSILSTTLSNIPPGSGKYEQAGLWFGVDEDNFNKLVVISFSTGLKIQHLMEVDGVVVSSVESSAPIVADTSLELRLRILPETTEIIGEYSLDDGTIIEAGRFIAPPEFFSFDAAGIDPLIGTRSFGGIFASHRNGSSPLTYRFDNFSVSDDTDGSGGNSVQFERSSISIQFPTALVWAPDNRLYVTELFGTIHALTYDQSLGVIDHEIITSMTDSLGARLTLGVTVDPASTPGNIILWVSHSSPSTGNGEPNSSTVTRLSGANFSLVENVITGLPRAKANHAINSIHFGPDGRLYMAMGGNTGAGAPNLAASEFGDFEEQPLSAALIVADVYAPDFDGSCNNSNDIFGPPPCDVEVYSSGLRNTYDFVFHSNGSVYAPDNGLGVTGTFPPSPFAPCFGLADSTSWTSGGHNPGTQPDLLNRLEFGRFYGHPNPYRDECIFKDGSYQNVSPPLNYTAPILDLGNHRSSNGIVEYPNSGIGGNQLGGDLLIANFSVGDDITRVRLEPGGLEVASSSSLVGDFNDPLPLAINPEGWIFVGEFGGDLVTVLRPEAIGSWTNEAPMPAPRLDAGAAAVGDNVYVVSGKNGSTYFPSLFVYNTVTNIWTQGPDMPTSAVENPGVTALEDKLWVFGGSTAPFSSAKNQALSFDPQSGLWTTLANLPTARTGAATVAYEGKIYVIGGLTSDGASSTAVEIYHPLTDSWSDGPDLDTPRDNAFATVLDGQIFVFGGRTRLASGTTVDGQLNTVEAHSSASGTWEFRSAMPTGRRAFALGTLNGRAQVIGGETAPNTAGVFDTAEEYNPVNNTWRALTNITTGRHGTATATVGTRVYVIGGAAQSGSIAVATHESFGFE